MAAKAPEDIVPPAMTGASLMAGFKNQMLVGRERRLQDLARSNPDVAELLKIRDAQQTKSQAPKPIQSKTK